MSVLRAVLVDFKANCKIENRIIKAKKKRRKKVHDLFVLLGTKYCFGQGKELLKFAV